MVRAWYTDSENGSNPREEQQRLPPQFITLENLYQITGVEYFQVNVETCTTDGTLEKIKEERGGYEHEDEIGTPDEADLELFFSEHLHEHEEIRLVMEGSAYYDIKDKNDEWIRIEMVAGDLLVIPSGCYHRFMLDNNNFVKMKRIFMKDSGYKCLKRPNGDVLEARKTYLKKLEDGVFMNNE